MNELIIKRRNDIYYRTMVINLILLFFIFRNINNYYLTSSDGNSVYLILTYIFGFLILSLFINSLRQLFKNNTAMIISDKGITDNFSMFKPGFVAWSEITNAEVKKYKGGLQLVLNLRDYEPMMAGESRVRTKILELYIRDLETPWVINTRLLKTGVTELHQIILEHIDRHSAVITENK